MKSNILIAVTSMIGGVCVGLIAGWLMWGASCELPAKGLKCPDGATPDVNGCCAGEEYTDMGILGFNCCPPGDGDCFPPIK